MGLMGRYLVVQRAEFNHGSRRRASRFGPRRRQLLQVGPSLFDMHWNNASDAGVLRQEQGVIANLVDQSGNAVGRFVDHLASFGRKEIGPAPTAYGDAAMDIGLRLALAK